MTIYYDMQYPYVYQYIETITQYCEMNDFSVSLIQVDAAFERRADHEAT